MHHLLARHRRPEDEGEPAAVAGDVALFLQALEEGDDRGPGPLLSLAPQQVLHLAHRPRTAVPERLEHLQLRLAHRRPGVLRHHLFSTRVVSAPIRLHAVNRRSLSTRRRQVKRKSLPKPARARHHFLGESFDPFPIFARWTASSPRPWISSRRSTSGNL